MVDATPRTPPMTLSFVALDAPPPPYPHDTSYSLTIHRPHPVRFNTDLPFLGYRSEPLRIVRSTVLPRTLRTDFNFRSIAESTDGDDDTLSLHNRDAAIFADQGSEQDSSEDNFDAATVAGSEHDGILRRGIGSRAAAAHGHNLLHSRMDTHQRMSMAMTSRHVARWLQCSPTSLLVLLVTEKITTKYNKIMDFVSCPERIDTKIKRKKGAIQLL